MPVAYAVLEYGDLIVAALAASDRLRLIYDAIENDVRQNQYTDSHVTEQNDCTCANCPYCWGRSVNADRDIFANVVAMRARLGQLQLVNSLVLSMTAIRSRIRNKLRKYFPRDRGKLAMDRRLRRTLQHFESTSELTSCSWPRRARIATTLAKISLSAFTDLPQQ